MSLLNPSWGVFTEPVLGVPYEPVLGVLYEPVLGVSVLPVLGVLYCPSWGLCTPPVGVVYSSRGGGVYLSPWWVYRSPRLVYTALPCPIYKGN